VRPAHRRVAINRDDLTDDLPAGSAEVIVVGGRCFGAVEAGLCRQALRLAEAAGVSLLRVSFSGREAGSYFTGAELRPDLSSDEVADAVLALFLGSGATTH